MSTRNYSRFYLLLNRLPSADREGLKEQLVSQYTDGRTTSLREVTDKEYDEMCRGMERIASDREERERFREELRRRRSTCLKLMQRMGIDTTDWARVNDFCRNPRIAGKPFARLSAEELEGLAVKLRVIQKKGGLRKSSPPQSPQKGEAGKPFRTMLVVPIGGMGQA